MRRILAASILIIFAAPAAAQSRFENALLGAHSDARADAGVRPLRWSAALADDARAWAELLSRRGVLAHAPRRPGSPVHGENLWAGTSGAHDAEDMVRAWLRERRLFHNGMFPAISTTGSWRDAGHYSQIIWHDTTDVGCGIAEGEHWEFLVCRYSPAGNVYSRKPLGN